ncbi:ParB/RepB/Spo0J family partition protein [Nonomuraea sp. NPDC050663]|uniref:ParB/RepB/Spo0J family partition protein n=1 Tax=Nonomuraea sp. NPDC050663 TaxID=3364370 RepID=UPI0037916A42
MARINDQEYVLLPVDAVTPHPDNANRGNVDLIAESIETNGFYGVVVVQKSRMRVIAGEHRWRGARAKGLAEFPAVVVDVDDETAKRIMLADNRTSEHSEYDEEQLVALLQSLPGLDGTGWTDDDLADLLDSLDDEIEIVADEPGTGRSSSPPPRPAHAEDDAESEEDDDDDLDEALDDGDEPAPAEPPRPRSGQTAELIVPLTADEHAEAFQLMAVIRERDGDLSLPQLVLAALRTHART